MVHLFKIWPHLIAGRVVGDVLWPREGGVGHDQPIHARAQRDCRDVGLVCLGQIWRHLPECQQLKGHSKRTQKSTQTVESVYTTRDKNN